MGLFVSRQEDPSDFGALPAEPYDPTIDKAVIDPNGRVSLFGQGGDVLGGGDTSVAISFDVPSSVDEGGDGDGGGDAG